MNILNKTNKTFVFQNESHKAVLICRSTTYRSAKLRFDIYLNSLYEFSELTFDGALYQKKNGSWVLTDGGQIQEKFNKIFGSDPSAHSFYCIWKRWHRNAHRKGTKEQEQFIRSRNYCVGKTDKEIYELLREHDLHDDCGVHYATYSLVEIVPSEVKRKLRKIAEKYGVESEML